MNTAVKCTECGYLAVLHTNGKFAGIWECENPKCGATDTHDHTNEDTRSYEVETWPTGPDDTGHTTTMQVYAVCGVAVND